MVRTIVEMDDEVPVVIIDVEGVDDYDKAAILMLASMITVWRDDGKDIIFIDWGESFVESILDYISVRVDLYLPDPRELSKSVSAGHIVLPYDYESIELTHTMEICLLFDRSTSL